MAPRTTTSLALFLVLNILFFTLVSACSTCPTPNPKPKPKPKPKPTPTPSKGNCPPPNPNPKPTPTPTPSKGTCPRDALKLNVCDNLLGGLIGIGIPQKSNCCSLLGGLTDLDAAICLCLAIQANILGINLNVPLSLSLLLNTCDKKVPTGFQCS